MPFCIYNPSGLENGRAVSTRMLEELAKAGIVIKRYPGRYALTNHFENSHSL